VPADRNGALAGAGTATSQTGLAVLMTLGSMVSVQVGAAFAHPTMDLYGPLATTWGRLAWAAVILGLIVRPDIRRYGRGELLLALALGAAIAVMTLAYFVAITRVPLGLVAAIEFLGPLGVAAWGFGRNWRLIWLVLALAGVFLLVRNEEGWTIDLVGLAFTLVAGIGWAGYIVLSKRIGKSFRGLDGLAISLIAAALITMPFGLYETGFTLPTDLAIQTMGLAVLTPLLPYALEMMALRRLLPATFGVLMSIEPGIGALAGYLILFEQLSLQQVLGIVCVISAGAGAVASARES